MHLMGGLVLGFAGGCGPAFLLLHATVGAQTMRFNLLHHSLILRRPQPSPRASGSSEGERGGVAGHFLASRTWISRKWDPGGGGDGEVKAHAPFSLWGAGVVLQNKDHLNLKTWGLVATPIRARGSSRECWHSLFVVAPDVCTRANQ